VAAPAGSGRVDGRRQATEGQEEEEAAAGCDLEEEETVNGCSVCLRR
jgi:hypothetical protein